MPIHGINHSSVQSASFHQVQYNAINDLLSAIDNGNVDLIRDILESDRSILEWRQGISARGSALQRVPGNRANVDDRASNVLHKAVQAGELEAVKVLCNEYQFPTGEQDMSSLTALHIACQMLHGENYSEQIQSYSENYKPNHYKIAEFLVNKAIDDGKTDILYRQDREGNSIVDIAYECELPELSRIVDEGFDR